MKELLAANRVPSISFSQAELAEDVQGPVKSDVKRITLEYRQLNDNRFVGPIRVLQYDKVDGSLVRPNLHLDETDICSGSPGDIYYVGEFTLLSTNLTPSAECLLVLGKDLELSQTLHGFSPIEVAPDKIVIIEDMIHFAPVHPERLQLADLPNRTTFELYPPKGDALRARLARENERHMPPLDICARMNDPCDPQQFDEEIRSLATDGKGRFAFLASQSASHKIKEGKLASQNVLYVTNKSAERGIIARKKSTPAKLEPSTNCRKMTSINFYPDARRTWL